MFLARYIFRGALTVCIPCGRWQCKAFPEREKRAGYPFLRTPADDPSSNAAEMNLVDLAMAQEKD